MLHDDEFLDEKLDKNELEALKLCFLIIDHVVDRDTTSEVMGHLWYELNETLENNGIDSDKLWVDANGDVQYGR